MVKCCICGCSCDVSDLTAGICEDCRTEQKIQKNSFFNREIKGQGHERSTKEKLPRFV